MLSDISVYAICEFVSGDPAARQQSLERYRDKKARRFNNSTKVRYEMRKVNADKRPRIKGRFVKPEELQSYLNTQAELH